MKGIQWTGHNDNMWMIVPETTKQIKPGIFLPQSGMMGWYLREVNPSHDKIIRLGVADYVYDTITKFYSSKSRYRALGLLHKRGFLLYGPPGTGKTFAAAVISNEVVKNGGIVLLCTNPGLPAQVCSGIREVHPDMPIMCLWEDIERWCEFGGDEDDRAAMTSFLDGEHQVDGIVHVATTNKFESLDPAFMNRPGRFDDVIYVGAPEERVRREYLMMLLPKSEAKLIDELATKSDGLLLSHLKDCLVSVFVLGHPVDETVDRLKKMIGRDAELTQGRKMREQERLAGRAAGKQVGMGLRALFR